VLTILVVLSAVSYFVGYSGIRRDNQMQLRVGSLVALLLLLVALIGQIRFMGQFPFTSTGGSFASTFIMLSGYHVYHMLIALFLGLGLTHRAFRGRYSRERMLGVITIGYFWYWTAAFPVLTWLLMLFLSPKV
jgi:cytochrome c oxidase subunit 3